MPNESYILGLDTSSTRTGITLLKGDFPVLIEIFESNKKDSLGKRLRDFGKYLQSIKKSLPKGSLKAIGVERDSVSRNLNTIRMLSYFEAVVLMKANEWGVPAIQYAPSSARKKALGKGNIKKEEVYNFYADKYDLLPYEKGGSDQADSLCLAEATKYDLENGTT